MEKFLSIPVTSEQTQLVSANNVLLVEQASTTTVTIAYAGGKVTTLTHATAGSGDETQRDAIQNAIVTHCKSHGQKLCCLLLTCHTQLVVSQ